MKNFNDTKKILKKYKNTIKVNYKVNNIGIFGSYIRGEQKKESDLDILVDFSQPVSFFTFLDLEEYLKNKLGLKIDLVTKNALKPDIGGHILKEVIYI